VGVWLNVQSPSDLRKLKAGSGGNEASFDLSMLRDTVVYFLGLTLTYALAGLLNISTSRINGAFLALAAGYVGIATIRVGRRRRQPVAVFIGSVLLFAPAIGLEIAMLFGPRH